jgi:hypothetical protein
MKNLDVSSLTTARKERAKMQRHGKPKTATGGGTKHLLAFAHAQVEAMDREISRGRPSGQGLHDELVRLIRDSEHQLAGRPLTPEIERQHTPAAWVESIISGAELRSHGIVEHHLVGATLQQRHPEIIVPNNPGHAGDAQTGRSGDFPLKDVSYHVTATDGKEATARCKENIESGVHPVLLVPRRYLENARVRADVAGIQDRVSILAIEDFITQNIIEMSTSQQQDFFSTLKAIIDQYNHRLEEVETDMSLKIELS